MTTPLHSADELEAIANGPVGPGRDWATARLAIMAPERFTHFPTGDLIHDVILAANPPKLIPALCRALESDTNPTTGLAQAAAMLGTYGVVPEDITPVVSAIDTAVDGSGNDADLWLATAAANLGVLNPIHLAAANRVHSADREWLLPGLVLQFADSPSSRELAAREIVKGIFRQIQQAPGPLAAILSTLGCPTDFECSRYWSPKEAADYGANIAGGTAPDLNPPKGSRKRQAQWWVQATLDSVDTPAAALLREAVKSTGTGIWTNWAVAIATWLVVYKPEDPVEDVMMRLAGANGTVLSQARRQVTHNKVQRILKRIKTGHLGAAMMSQSIKDRRIAGVIVNHVATLQRPPLTWEVLAAKSAWSTAQLVPQLIKRRDTRSLGLLMAEWAPTEEVLEILLRMQVPRDPDQKLQYGCALAAMGDTSVVQNVAALTQGEGGGGFRHAMALIQDLLS